MKRENFDVIVIGGGLAGLAASLNFKLFGRRTLLIDGGLSQAEGRLGGFAEFSGAKFSLLPAGQGLIPLAGSRRALESLNTRMLDLLDLPKSQDRKTVDRLVDLPADLELRSYTSIVLTPLEMRSVLDRLVAQLETKEIICQRVTALKKLGGAWQVTTSDGDVRECSQVLFAGGRTGEHLLRKAGALPQPGKGIDVGARIEFINREGLQGLRSIGPDAKILKQGVRTFCLNHPGKIFYYPFENYSIPGGVVAESDFPRANVGLLHRVANKTEILDRTKRLFSEPASSFYQKASSSMAIGIGDKLRITQLTWGDDVANSLQLFCESLGDAGLVDWSVEHKVHWPLLDWHWDVFGRPGTAETSCSGLFVAGDSAGHARGLLQAVVSGWLAAAEMSNGS
jgi:FAD binding domain